VNQKSTSPWTKVAIWGTVIALLALLGWGLLRRGETRPQVGAAAPDFTLRLFDGYYSEFDEGQVTLADLKGRVVVINFWASWCVECRVEARGLEETWQAYRDRGVVLIGVDYDDTEVKARAYLEEFGITYPNGLDGRGRISNNSYRITGVPETFIVDPAGKIAYVKIGPFQPGELRRTIDSVLGTP
jgi:cytochrome c biogenesis protein CcmG/thiol:disulfide interchange protein DsbE